MTFLVALFISLIAVPAFSSNGFVVGNAGDGFLLNNRVELRDLVEMGAEKNPEFGLIESSAYLQQLKQKKWRIDFNHKLLSKKLVDLDLFYPSLGLAVLDVLMVYDWIPVQAPLEFTDHAERIVAPEPSAQYVQIANRLESTVRIHLPFWNLMPEEHQVALLIHEAFQSLSRLECTYMGKPVCQPNGRKIRELTGKVFLVHNHSSSLQLGEEIALALRLPTHSIPLRHRSVHASVVTATLEGTAGVGQAQTINFSMGGYSSLAGEIPLSFAVTKICEKWVWTESRQSVSLQLKVNEATPTFFVYHSSFGIQSAVKWRTPGTRSSEIFEVEQRNCVEVLVRKFQSLENPGFENY